MAHDLAVDHLRTIHVAMAVIFLSIPATFSAHAALGEPVQTLTLQRGKYSLSEPSAIDFEFECHAHNKELFGKHGYAVLFFADYMNDVEEVALHFRGVSAADTREQWISAEAPPGH